MEYGNMKWCFIYNMVNWEYKKGMLYKRKLIEGIFGYDKSYGNMVNNV